MSHKILTATLNISSLLNTNKAIHFELELKGPVLLLQI